MSSLRSVANHFARLAFSPIIGLLASACVGSAGSSGGYGAANGGTLGPGFGRQSERQFIGSYSEVRGVGVSRRYVYAATQSGIAIYDRVFSAWQTPLTRENGFAFGDQISFMTGDPVEDAVWIGVPGAVLIYRPQTEQIQRTILPGVPDFIAFYRSNVSATGLSAGSVNSDAVVRTSGLWSRVSRTGLVSPLSQPPSSASLILPVSLDEIYQRYPILRTSAGMLLREQKADRSLRNYPVISGAVSPERGSEVWLGTNGDGLYRVDPSFQQATSLRFGPVESAIGALAAAADGVWMAGGGQSDLRSGFSFTTNDLQRWRWIDGTISVPMVGVRANAMSVRGSRAWVATERGVVSVNLDGSDALESWTSLDGLPGDRAFAVAARDGGAWVGTAQGLVWLSDSIGAKRSRSRGIGMRLLDNVTIFALQPVGDTLWIGTSGGLVALPQARAASADGAAAQLLRPAAADPELRRPIRALAWSDTVLLVATDNAIIAVNPRGAAEPTRIETANSQQVGRLTRVAIDSRSIAISGSDGVILMSRRTGASTFLRAPGDLPAPAMDVLLTNDWMWIATTAGLARFKRAEDGGLR